MVEDEKETADNLKQMVLKFMGETHETADISCYDNAKTFLNTYVKQYQLVFMDINLPNLNGMDAVHLLREKDKDVTVIFVTSLAQYAVKGYEVSAFDFIVKPVNYFDFRLKLIRVMKMLAEKSADSKRILIHNRSYKQAIECQDIIYIEVINHSLVFHTAEGDYTENKPLKMIEQELEGLPFSRCNQCYLVNLKYVSKVEEYNLYLGNTTLLISHPRKKEFMSALNNYYLNGGGL